MALNEKRGSTIQSDCSCRGQNPVCPNCAGRGTVTSPACKRCGGTGKEGGAKCLDCRGLGERSIDKQAFMDDHDLLS